MITITNSDELGVWIWDRREHGCFSVKGPAPQGLCYEDGTPVTLPVNIAWVDNITGERIEIEFGET